MRPIGEKLVIATHNPGKLREIAELIEPLGIACVGAEELGLPEPEEIGNTFLDNADLKAREAADLSGIPALSDDSGLCVDALHGLPGIFSAREAADLSGLPALSDDSGLCVDALHGLPGIFSARWAEDSESNRDWMRAMERVWTRLQAAGPDSSRDAHFACALSLAWPNDGQIEGFEGRVDGTLVWPPRGDKGFGYDPMFVPAGHEQTFGEMDPAEKHTISHRARAFRKLVAALK